MIWPKIFILYIFTRFFAWSLDYPTEKLLSEKILSQKLPPKFYIPKNSYPKTPIADYIRHHSKSRKVENDISFCIPWCVLSSDENKKMFFNKNYIWNLFNIHKWFWCVLSDDENEKIILHKCHIWNLFDLHDCFPSSDENDKIIFDKNHM